MKHVISYPEAKMQKLLNGRLRYDFHFFKKKSEFSANLSAGDNIFFRKKRGEVMGQFGVGKLIIIEGVDKKDWLFLKAYGIEEEYGKEKFEENTTGNNILVIMQVVKVEQFITSPIEIDKKSKKEWIVLEN
jgi:hypothetical protein